jgi:hypothetical protein
MSGLYRALEAIQRKSDDVFAVEIEGIEVVFRLPPVQAAQQYSLLLNMAQTESERLIIYETIFRDVVEDDLLASEDGDIMAGVPETISKLVLMMSGLDNSAKEYTAQLFGLYRQQSSSVLMCMKRAICTAFPGYTFESLGQLNYQNLVNVFIQAEKILLERGIIESEYDFMSSEETKEAPFAVEDLIKQDRDAYHDYEFVDQEDPRKLARMNKLREAARRRAEEEERVFKERYRRRQQG